MTSPGEQHDLYLKWRTNIMNKFGVSKQLIMAVLFADDNLQRTAALFRVCKQVHDNAKESK